LLMHNSPSISNIFTHRQSVECICSMSDSVSVRAVILWGVNKTTSFANMRGKETKKQTECAEMKFDIRIFFHISIKYGENSSCVYIFLTYELTWRVTEVGWMEKKHATTTK
jgi:hypothetical protein